MTDIMAQVIPIIQRALNEDIGKGDVTTRYTVPPQATLSGQFVTRESGIIAGLEVAKMTFSLVDKQIRFTSSFADGDWMEAGTSIATVSGPGRALLSCERVALNFLQRMSGIATMTHQFVEAVRGTSAIILDTRKTAPGLRILDKWAVRIGGGQNHRFGLYDMVLIKDNHISAVGSISKAVERIRREEKQGLPIEVEVRTLEELQEALRLNVDRIMLDNMSLEEIQEAVNMAKGSVPLEVSGNVTLENVAAIAATGVDYISVGTLTHSVHALDIGLVLN